MKEHIANPEFFVTVFGENSNTVFADVAERVDIVTAKGTFIIEPDLVGGVGIIAPPSCSRIIDLELSAGKRYVRFVMEKSNVR